MAFVVAGNEAAVLNDVLAALGGVFTLEPEGDSGEVWLDTFDHRLYRSGRTLTYLSNSVELADHGKKETQRVPGWRPPRAGRAASDLPPGPVARRVAKLAAPRALLLQATSVTSTTRLIADGEVAARLIVRRAAVPGKQVPAYVQIAGAADHVGYAERVVAGVPGILPASDAFPESILAAAASPADAPDPITAKEPAGQAVAQVLLGLLDTMEANVDGVLGDLDTEFLHDFRVAVRRTRAALKLLGDVLDPLDPSFAGEFKWLGDLTTPVRDLDVHLLGFGDLAGRLRVAEPADLEPLRELLERRRGTELKRLRGGLRSLRYQRLTQAWRQALIRTVEQNSVSTPAAELAAARIAKAFKRVAKRGARITADSPPEAMHDLRKRCKELRYAIEFFGPVFARSRYRQVISDLKRLQDCLGAYQDAQVQIAEIRTAASQLLSTTPAPAAGPATPTTAAAVLAMGELLASIKRDQIAAREDFERRFAAFAGPAGAHRMAALLRTG